MENPNNIENEKTQEEKEHFPINSSQPLVLVIKNNTKETIENVELFNPSVQIDNNEVQKEGITVQGAIVGVTYKKILYGINSPMIICYFIIDGINDEKPLEFIKWYKSTIFGVTSLMPINIEERGEVKTIGKIKTSFELSNDVSIIIPFILPEQTLRIYFYPAAVVDLGRGLSNYIHKFDSPVVNPYESPIEKEEENENSNLETVQIKKQNIFKRIWRKIYSENDLPIKEWM